MISPQEFLKTTIYHYLGQIFTDFDEDTVKVDLWKGKLTLANMNVKPSLVARIDGFELQLERGIIRHVDAAIPWAVLNMGRADVKCVVDDCDLCFRLRISDDDTTDQNTSSGDNNMVRLVEEELRLLGEPQRNESGLTRLLAGGAAQILQNISVSVTNLKISAILPLLNGQELVVSLVVASVDIASQAPPQLKNPRLEVSMSKNVSVHGLSITTSLVGPAPPPATARLTARARAKIAPPQIDILLCPSYFNLSVWGYRASTFTDNKSNLVGPSGSAENVIGVEGSISNLEFLVNESQMLHIHQFVSLITSQTSKRQLAAASSEFWSVGRKYYKFKRLLFMRFYFSHNNESSDTGSNAFYMDPRTRFLLAVRTVIQMNRLRRGQSDRALLARLTSTRLLHHYSTLYRRYLFDKFTEFNLSGPDSDFLDDDGSIEAYATTYVDSSSSFIVSEMVDLQSVFAPRELLLYRTRVYLSLLRLGVRAKAIRRTVYESYKPQYALQAIAVDGYLTGWSESPSLVSLLQDASFEDVEDFLYKTDYVTLPWMPSHTPALSTRPSSIILSVSLDRLSLSVLESRITTSSSQKSSSKKPASPTSLLSLALYGFRVISNDLSIESKLDSLRLVDSHGNVVISCGISEDFNDSFTDERESAFSFTIDLVEYALVPAVQSANTSTFFGESFETEEPSLMVEQITKSLHRLQQLAFTTSSSKQKNSDVFSIFKQQYSNASMTRQHAISAARVGLITIVLDTTFLTTVTSLSHMLRNSFHAAKSRLQPSYESQSTLTLPKIVTQSSIANRPKVSMDVLSEGILLLVPVNPHRSLDQVASEQDPSISTSLGTCFALKTGKCILLSGDNLGGWISTDVSASSQSSKHGDMLIQSFRRKLDSFVNDSSDIDTSRVPIWFRSGSQQQAARSKKSKSESTRLKLESTPDDTDIGEFDVPSEDREGEPDSPQLQWNDVERNLKLTARKVCADGDAPFLYSISKLEFGFTNEVSNTESAPFELSTSLLEKPVQISGLFYSSNQLLGVSHMDTFASAISVTFSFEDLLRAGDVARQLNESLRGTSHKRLNSSVTYDVSIDNMGVSFIDPQVNIYSLSLSKLKFELLGREVSNSKEECRKCLDTYLTSISEMRFSPRVVLTAQKIAVYQLESLGVPADLAEEVLHHAFMAAVGSSMSVDSLVTLLADVVDGFIDHKISRKQRNYLPLCCAVVHKLQLRYDVSGMATQLGVGLESLSVIDKEGIPLLNLLPADRTSKYSECEDSFHDGILEINQHKRRHPPPFVRQQLAKSQSTYLQSRPLTSMNSFKEESEARYRSPTCYHISSLHPALLETSQDLQNSWSNSSKALSLLIREESADQARHILVELASVDVLYFSFTQLDMLSDVLKMASELKRRYQSSPTAATANVTFGGEVSFTGKGTPVDQTPVKYRSSSPHVRESIDTTLTGRFPLHKSKSLPVSRVFTSIAIAVKAVNVNIGFEKRLFSQLCLQNAMISGCTDELSKANAVQRLASFGARIGDLGLYDLSVAGALHSKVLWNLKCDDSPVVLVDVNQKDSLAHFHGLRCCLVNRFVQETTVLLSEKVASPLFRIFAEFDDHGQSETSPARENSSFFNDNLQEVSQPEDIREVLSSIGSVLSSDSMEDEMSESESEYSDDGKSSDSSKDFEVYVLRSANDMRARLKASGQYPVSQPRDRLQSFESKQSTQFQSPSMTDHSLRRSPSKFENKHDLKSNPSFHVKPTKDLWKVDMVDFVVFMPRNTCSLDLVGVSVGSSLVQSRQVNSTFDAPKETVECKSTNAFIFDPDRNIWRHTHDDEAYYSSIGRFVSPFDRESHLYHHDQKKREDDLHAELLTSRSHFNETSTDPYSRLIFTLNNVRIFVSLSGALINFDGSARPDLSVGEEFSPLEIINKEYTYCRRKRKTDQQVVYKQQVWREITAHTFNMAVLADLNSKEYRFAFMDTSDVSTLSLNLSMAELYLLISLWYDNISEKIQFFPTDSEGPSSDVNNKSELYLPKYGTPDYFEFLRSRPSTWAVAFVRSELLLRCFIDHQYFSKDPDCLKLLLAPLGGQLNDDMKSFFSSSNDYGFDESTDGCNNPGRDTHNLNTARSDVNINFTRKPDNGQNLAWENIALPTAELVFSGLMLFTTGDKDVSSTSLTSSVTELWDIRKPPCAPHPYSMLMKVGSHRIRRRSAASNPSHGARLTRDKVSFRRYIAPNLNYGLNLHPSDIETTTYTEKGLYVSSIYSASSNWATSHVGIYSPECTLPNIEVVALLQEYFGSYFWSPEYGSPVVNAYAAAEKQLAERGEKLPYGGYDFRLFLFKPVVSIPEKPTDPESQILFLETEKGVYFRLSKDTLSNISYQVNASGIAMVVSKTPMAPALCRGVRGAAGSGRGIRTLLEYLSLSFAYSYHQESDSIDIFIDVFPTLEAFSSDANDSMLALHFGSSHIFPPLINRGPFMEISQERPHLTFYPIAPPTAVRPIVSPGSQSNNMESCDIVTSLEDLYFLQHVGQTFLGLQKPVNVASDEVLHTSHARTETTSTTAPVTSMYVVASLTYVKFVLVDNLLGLHLPLAQAILHSGNLSIDQSKSDGSERSNRDSIRFSESSALGATEQFQALKVHSVVKVHSDYFNSVKKCWEPLLEGISLSVLYEKSLARGEGFVFKFGSTIHINCSDALIKCVEDTVKMFRGTRMYSSTTQREVDMAYLLSSQIVSPGKNSRAPSPEQHREGGAVPRLSISTNGSSVEDEDDNQLMAAARMNNRLIRSRMKTAQKRERRKQRRGSAAPQHLAALSQASEMHENMKTNQHLHFASLNDNVRVGFSILNLTGQSLRYLQTVDGGHKIVQYLNHNERGILNFLASKTTIRNNQIVEEAFAVQQDLQVDKHFRAKRKVIGHHVALQIAGFDWLPYVQADELGCKFLDVDAVLGRLKAIEVLKSKQFDQSVKFPFWKYQNALKLVTEVVPHNGGRLLKLRSVFRIVNRTSHKIDVLSSHLQSSRFESQDEIPFTIAPGESFDIPLALLHMAATQSTGLGRLWLRPADLSLVRDAIESGHPNLVVDRVDYQENNIDLLSLVEESAGMFHSSKIRFRPDGSIVSSGESAKGQQLCCFIRTKPKRLRRNASDGSTGNQELATLSGGHETLPPFCYNVDVRRIEPSLARLASSKDSTDDKTSTVSMETLRKISKASDSSNSLSWHENDGHPPLHYSIDIHSPITLENLLPTDGLFEIFHATTKRAIWKSNLGPGESICVHTLTLDDPLLLKITLRYCKTVEGVLINKPRYKLSETATMGDRVNKFVEDLLFDDFNEGDSYVDLVDTVGQRLKLGIENTEGSGGERRITIYSPYWIVNTSQYAIRIKDERSGQMPAGTVYPNKDGSRPIIDFSTQRKQSSSPLHGQSLVNPTASPLRTHPGLPGVLHSSTNKEISIDSSMCEFLGELPAPSLQALSFMFNYQSPNALIGQNRVSVQMDDSEWSASFSLDNLEINQTIIAYHSSRGTLEVGLKVRTALGRLSKYTKIVRFMPHVVVVNNLSYNLRFLQPTGYSGKFIDIPVTKGHLKPFHFPDANSERKLSIQVDDLFDKSVVFGVDFLGEQIISVSRRQELSSIVHFNTRGMEEYDVFLPAHEIGLYFETDWQEHNIVVKGFKKNSFAASQTDIQIGDVLISVDGIPVGGPSFTETMTLLKDKTRVGANGCVARFRTVEEKMRLIRSNASGPNVVQVGGHRGSVRAVGANRNSVAKPRPSSIFMSHPSLSQENDVTGQVIVGEALSRKSMKDSSSRKVSYLPPSPVPDSSVMRPFNPEFFKESEVSDKLHMKIEIRQTEATMLILVQNSDIKESEYKIHNHSLYHTIAYKQKNVANNFWKEIQPGEVVKYQWDDPFKAHKLLIRVSSNLLCPVPLEEHSTGLLGLASDFAGGFNLQRTLDASSSVVNFDDFRYKGTLSTSQFPPQTLSVEVSSEGPSKTLNILPFGAPVAIMKEIKYAREFSSTQIRLLSEKLAEFQNVLSPSGTIREIEISEFLDYSKSTLIRKLQEAQEQMWNEANRETVISKAIKSKSTRMGLQDLIKDPLNLKQEDYLQGFAPIESLYGSYDIASRDQLLVQVLEAKDLKPFVVGKSEDVFCRVRLKLKSMTDRRSEKYSKSGYTYMCEETLEPRWLDQRFVLNVPPHVVKDTRGVSVRVTVATKSVVHIPKVLGKTDINLSCLKHEEPVIGWFPLRPAAASTRPTTQTFGVIGSIKLKLLWIHSNTKLCAYNVEAAKHRIMQLEKVGQASYQLQKRISEQRWPLSLRRSLNEARRRDHSPLVVRTSAALVDSVREIGSAFSGGNKPVRRLSVPKSISLRDRLLLLDNPDADEEKSGEEKSSPREAKSPTPDLSPASPRVASPLLVRSFGGNETPLFLSGRASNKAKMNSRRSVEFKPSDDTVRPFRLSKYDDIISRWVALSTSRMKPGTKTGDILRDHMSSWMKRSSQVTEEQLIFNSLFIDECDRTNTILHTSKGKLEITPMQALHIPETNKPLCVKLSYGSVSQTTFSVPHASDISWYYDYNDNGNNPNIGNSQGNDYPGASNDAAGATRNEYLDARNSSLAKTFEVDCFNSRGLLRIRVLADHMTKRVEIARLRVPLFNILDCVCQLGEDETYTRWFPLLLTKDSIASEGEIEMFGQSNFSEQSEPFEYQPCIRLMFRWTPIIDTNADEPAKSISYQDHIQELTRNQKLYIRGSLPSVSISVIDSDLAREIVQICASRIEFRKYANSDYTDYIFYTDTFQIDNQLTDSITPVLLHQTQAKFQQPIIRLLLRKNNQLSNLTPNLTCYDNFQLVIQELDVHLEQQTVVASWELSQRVSPMLVNIFPPLKDPVRGSGRDLNSSATNLFGSSSAIEDSLYIERFSLNGIKINMSFLMTPEVVESHRKRTQSRDAQVQYGAGVLTASSSFLRQVGEVVLDLTSNITNTPIFLSGMDKDHLSMSGRELTAKLQDIYFQSLVREIYKLVGSLELVGNPYLLFSSLGVGVKSFFVEPANAIINTPADFEKIGIATLKGTVVLVSKATDGVIGFGTSITRSFGRLIAKLSMDEVFTYNREELQRPPLTAMGTCLRPLKDIRNGLYCGIVGLARVPARNYRQHGVAGLIPGIAKGVAGLPTKVVVGALDAITHTGDMMRQAVKAMTKTDQAPVNRWRLSTLFGPDGRILPYQFTIALGAQTLYVLNQTRIPNVITGEREIQPEPKRRQSFKVVAGLQRALSTRFNAPIRRSSIESTMSAPGMRRLSMWQAGMFGAGQTQEESDSAVEFDNSVVLEFVIHTSIIAQDSGADRLVVVSTKRIVVADYKRSRIGPLHVKCWEANMNDVMSCDFEKLGGKPKVTIIATKGNKETRVRRRRSSVATDFQDGLFETFENTKALRNTSNSITITGDYRYEDSLTILNNCINTMLHAPYRIHDLEKDTPEFFEDAFDVVHIGPWKFDVHEGQLPGEAKDLRLRQQQLIEDLRMEKWIVSDDTYANGPASTVRGREPSWLENERKAAVAAHDHISEVARSLKLSPRMGIDASKSSKSVISTSGFYWPEEAKYNELLSKGLISYDEYVAVRKQSNMSEIMEFLKDSDNTNSPSKQSILESQRALAANKPKRKSLTLKLRATNWFKSVRSADDDDSEDAGRQSVSSIASIGTPSSQPSLTNLSVHPIIKALTFRGASTASKNEVDYGALPSQRVSALNSLRNIRLTRGSGVLSFLNSGKGPANGSDTSRRDNEVQGSDSPVIQSDPSTDSGEDPYRAFQLSLQASARPGQSEINPATPASLQIDTLSSRPPVSMELSPHDSDSDMSSASSFAAGSRRRVTGSTQRRSNQQSVLFNSFKDEKAMEQEDVGSLTASGRKRLGSSVESAPNL